MVKVSEITRPYFSHDEDARGDDKILKMFFTFRKLANEMTEEELRSFVPIGAYGIFWSVIEYMHRNGMKFEDVELLADDLRINERFIKIIMNEFDLFEKEEGYYVSGRVNRNLNKQKEKQKQNSNAAKMKWLLSAYDKAYKNEFGITPVLDDDERKNLYSYADKVENLKELLPDIFYTLKSIKFYDNTRYNPRTNWLLKGNNLARVIHGEFGKLKHKKTEKEIEAEKQAEQQKIPEIDEIQLEIESISSRAVALDYLCNHSTYASGLNKVLINPQVTSLLAKFDITEKEVKTKVMELQNG